MFDLMGQIQAPDQIKALEETVKMLTERVEALERLTTLQSFKISTQLGARRPACTSPGGAGGLENCLGTTQDQAAIS